MIDYLSIKNLALLDAVQLDLETGFLAVTGETGAGKSVLLGALSLLAGERSDKSKIKQGQGTCEVEASIHLSDTALIDSILDHNGLPMCDEGSLIIRRQIHRKKSGHITINGALSTQSILSQVGQCWIDFHGPGDHQQLFNENYQLSLIDAYAGHLKKVNAYEQEYDKWLELNKERERIANAGKLSPDEADFIRSQIERIDSVGPSPESISELESDYARVSNQQDITEYAAMIEASISGEIGAVEKLSSILSAAESLAEMDESARDLFDRINGAIIELEDVASEVAQLAEGTDMEPEAMQELQQRMHAWMEIKRRYGASTDAVLTKRAELAYKLESQADVESSLAKLDEEIQSLEVSLKKKAAALTETRMKASKKLCTAAMKRLKLLGFKQAKLDIHFEGDSKLHRYGDKKCRLLFQPNSGQSPMPLNKIASSGETARVMLAIKAALAETDATPVLVFDEVDANVGGEVGASVGAELKKLGDKHQVFCVTHLPQVAAQAESHYIVEKEQDSKSTQVSISPLQDDKQQRIAELARMLGDRNATSALKHAESLLG